jgi:putative flippase GtrA
MLTSNNGIKLKLPPMFCKIDRILEFLRFSVVGIVVAATFFTVFVTLSSTGMSVIAVNTLSLGVAVTLQYFLHSKWTFKYSAKAASQVPKFLFTVFVSLLLSLFITFYISPLLGWGVVLNSLAITMLLPISNFILFKIWVFR